jgi:hypothetical protein
MRTAQRFTEAENVLNRGERFAPAFDSILQERQQLASVRQEFEQARQAELQKAEIDGQRQNFASQASAGKVKEARASFDRLKQLLPPSDPFITTEAPNALGAAYATSAKSRFERKDYKAALAFAQEGLRVSPGHRDLTNVLSTYTLEANAIEVSESIASASVLDVATLQKKTQAIRNQDPGRYAALENEWAGQIRTRLGLLRSDQTQFMTLLNSAKELFPGNSVLESIKKPPPPPESKAKLIKELDTSLRKGLLSKALRTANSVDEVMRGDNEVAGIFAKVEERRRQATDFFNASNTAYESKDYQLALRNIDQAVGIWRDSSKLRNLRKEIVAARQATDAGSTSTVAGTGTTGTTTTKRAIDPPAPPTQPCGPTLAGYGKRKMGMCFDFVAGKKRGPLMVVVPAGSGTTPYAIAKYEISVGDFNRYCDLSGECQKISGSNRLPASGISATQVKTYAKWLSARTGYTYRLPNAAEWSHAAEAGGKQPKKDYNCRVAQGSEIIKGQSLMDVNAGQPNGWGLYNYVDNAQEWIDSGGGVSVRGGAFTDPFSKCDISLERGHDGSADEATGFRLLRELG